MPINEHHTFKPFKNKFEARRLIEHVTFQYGPLYVMTVNKGCQVEYFDDVRLEEGTSIFEIYPYLTNHEGVADAQGIIIKLNRAALTKEQFIEELVKGDSLIQIVEYSTLGKRLKKFRAKSK